MKNLVLAGLLILSGLIGSGCNDDSVYCPQPLPPVVEPFPDPAGDDDKIGFVRPESDPRAADDPLFDKLIAEWKAARAAKTGTAPSIETDCVDVTLAWNQPTVYLGQGETVTVSATLASSADEHGFQRVALSYNENGVGITNAAPGSALPSGASMTNNYNGFLAAEYVGLWVGTGGNVFQDVNGNTFAFTFQGLSEGTYYVEFIPSGGNPYMGVCLQQIVADNNADDDGDCLLCDETNAYGGQVLGVGSNGNRLKLIVIGVE